MLIRSRSWPIQSVITLDPRVIIYAKVKPQQQQEKKPRNAGDDNNSDNCSHTAKPDVVLEANDRFTFPTQPDIFLTVNPKESAYVAEPIQISFVDHYKVLDAAKDGGEEGNNADSMSSEDLFIADSSKRKNDNDECALVEDAFSAGKCLSKRNKSIKVVVDVENTNAKSSSCKLCQQKIVGRRKPVQQDVGEDEDEIQIVQEETKQFLSSYQIDILRKKNMRKRESRESSFDFNYSFGKETKRKQIDRKPTLDGESIASNDTKITDCDDKCGPRRNIKGNERQDSFHFIRSYSLGHEKTTEKLPGPFKKFSLPTPNTLLKDRNAETDPDKNDVALRSLNLDKRKITTLTRHYYPEGGWGYVVVTCSVMVHILCHGLQLAAGVIMIPASLKFNTDPVHTGWLGALSTAVALFLSPITIAFCKRKSTRVTAVVGGLITALGCLFTSFASQFHQLFFSYGTVIGVGVSLTRDCSTLMVAQYFKRRRELVEIFIVSGSGLGISIMSACIQGAINAIGWRLGLQAVTGAIFLTFILGTFYRSASLYHPQRRAILHLKNQKRKIKDKNKVEGRPAFLDTTALKSKTVRILLASTGLSAFGINTPIFYLARQAEQEGLGERAVLLQAYLGLAWVLGCAAFGLVVVHNSVECRIARQYLCQAAIFMCGFSILALTAVHGNYHGYVLFVWIYGIFCGGYHYSLKMYTYEKVRARNFAKTWGFVQCSQAIPIALGVPISGYMNEGCGGKAGYYFSSTCTLAGSLAMFLIDVHKRRIARHKHTKANGQRHRCESDACPQRRPSIGAEPDPEPHLAELPVAELIPGVPGEKPELTCISEEGIADMDLPDNLLDDLDYIGITSCNKVENYLMLSEFENNLIAETPTVTDKRGRRWSLAKRSEDQSEEGGKWRVIPQKRTITVIDEASV